MQRVERIQFHFHGAGWAALPPGSTFGPRTLRDYEFLWLLEGDVHFEVNGRARSFPPGSVALLRPGMRDYYRWDPARKTRAVYVHFHFMRRGAKLPPEKNWPLVQVLSEGDILRPLLRHLTWLLDQRRAEYRPLAQGAARQLLLSFISGAFHTRGEYATDLPPPLVRALRQVRERWSRGRVDTPTLHELAKAAWVSEGHLCRLFRGALGCGPLQALRMMRVDRAGALLAESNLQVQEIARLTGFENPFHFSRCFKEAFGVPPRTYRRKASEGRVIPQTRLLTVRRLTAPFWD